MAMICRKCGGIISDITLDPRDRGDCKYHKKGEINIDFGKWR